MKGIFFICFLFANALITDAQIRNYVYKVIQIGDPLTRINGIPAKIGQSFTSIQDIQFMNCRNAYIVAEKSSINSSVGIGSRCQNTKIIPYVAQEILLGFAHEEIPAVYDHLQTPVKKNFGPVAHNTEVPEEYIYPSTNSFSTTYRNSTASSEPNFNFPDDLHKTVMGAIIIGSFKEKSNAETELLRIRAEGYSPHSSAYGAFTRVGILFEYSRPSELEQMITTIREKYNPDAFFIKLSNSDF